MSHSITSVLSQIRSMQSQVNPAVLAGDLPRSNAIENLGDAKAITAPSFSQTLKGALKSVNEAQLNSGQLAAAFEQGQPGADLAKVMVAAQQSQLAFRATVEVRNRLVQAYQDVMNMPL